MEKNLKKEYKKRLLERRKELESVLKEFSKKDETVKGNWKTAFPQFGDHTSEQDENADEVEEYNNLLSVEHRLELLLLDVDRAIKKLRKKGYGICEHCGKEILSGRIRLVPEAKYCSECAKKIK